MGHFLLVNALLSAVARAPEDGRVVIVSSETHRGQPDNPRVLDVNDLFAEGLPEAVAGFECYGRSKLANLLFAKQLACRLEVSLSGHPYNSIVQASKTLMHTL
eukprot:8910375-Pyramimonas_sp.AAC.1